MFEVELATGACNAEGGDEVVGQGEGEIQRGLGLGGKRKMKKRRGETFVFRGEENGKTCTGWEVDAKGEGELMDGAGWSLECDD